MRPLLTRKQVGDLLGVTTRTLDTLRGTDPIFPPAVRIGGSVRWTPDAIERYVDTKTGQVDIEAPGLPAGLPGRRKTATEYLR